MLDRERLLCTASADVLCKALPPVGTLPAVLPSTRSPVLLEEVVVLSLAPLGMALIAPPLPRLEPRLPPLPVLYPIVSLNW